MTPVPFKGLGICYKSKTQLNSEGQITARGIGQHATRCKVTDYFHTRFR